MISTSKIDLKSPDGNVEAFSKVRCSLDGNPVYCWWSGTILSMVPDEPSKILFKVEGLNVARLEKIPGGYQMLSREIMFYKDPKTGEVLNTWVNPWTKEEVEVLHVQNDPVNLKYVTSGPRGPFHVPYDILGEHLFFRLEVPLLYPSPLSRREFPDNSASDFYQACECFNFCCLVADVMDPNVVNVPTTLTWSRVSQFLPWMKMGDRPGTLVSHVSGKKLMGGFQDLPESFRALLEEQYPLYTEPPQTWTQPNMTSWSYFKEVAEARRRSRLPSWGSDLDVAEDESGRSLSTASLASSVSQGSVAIE